MEGSPRPPGRGTSGASPRSAAFWCAMASASSSTSGGTGGRRRASSSSSRRTSASGCGSPSTISGRPSSSSGRSSPRARTYCPKAYSPSSRSSRTRQRPCRQGSPRRLSRRSSGPPSMSCSPLSTPCRSARRASGRSTGPCCVAGRVWPSRCSGPRRPVGWRGTSSSCGSSPLCSTGGSGAGSLWTCAASWPSSRSLSGASSITRQRQRMRAASRPTSRGRR